MTTVADAAPRWWSTTWGRLASGDEIQAPDGSVWQVGAAITSDGAGEWLISSGRGSVWTPHREDGPVTARRPESSGPEPDAELALGRLRAVLGDVEPVPLNTLERPGAGRWLRCGARQCTCW